MLRGRLAAKRPRLPAMSAPSALPSDDSSTSASSSTSSFTPNAVRDTPGAADSIREELRRTALELEPVAGKEPTQVVGYRPTYRAVLARKGYLIRNTLGSGSYSKVKRALSFKSSSVHLAAVKIIDRFKAPQDYQEKFMPRELKLWPLLNHPNLIALTDWFQDSRRVYMILEYADGGDALRYVQRHGAITESLARRWTVQIADAVGYMHDLDISHRDLKLENLLLDWNKNIKICDFGFVKAVGSSTDVLSRTYCGSKSYAAPEILTGVPYDPKKSDIWAIGVILYIFVTGKMPFDETKGTKSILEEQRQLDFRWAKSSKRLPSSACQALIRRMFVWDFTTRPAINVILNDVWFKMTDLPIPHTMNAGLLPHKGGDVAVKRVNSDCLELQALPVTKITAALETQSRRAPASPDN